MHSLTKTLFSILAVTVLSITASFAAGNSENWKVNWKTGKVQGEIQSSDKYSGKYALETLVNDKKGKLIFLRDGKIPVLVGKEYQLSGWVKSNTATESGARIMLQYLDENGKYLNVSRGIYAGGNHDWLEFKRKVTIPEKVAFVRLAAGGYHVPGKSYFDDIAFSDSAKPLAVDGFEDFAEASSANVWRIRVKVPEKKINSVVDIVHFGTDSDLVHYTGPDSIENLSLSCDYKVVKPGACYLSSNYYSSYWYTIHLKKLTTSLAWSDEKLDLSSAGAKVAKIPFQKRFSRFFDPVTKGENCVRGHHYFCIYDQNGKVIGQTKSANALVHPEASVFGKRQRRISASNRASLYTIANLNDFSLSLAQFQADWKSGGSFAFKVTIKDGDGDVFDINKVTSLSAKVDGIEIKNPVPRFAKYDIPTGWFAGEFSSKEPPEKLKIDVIVSAAKDGIISTRKVSANFVAGENHPPFVLDNPAPEPAGPAKEARMIMLQPHVVLSIDPAEGKKQIHEIIAKSKENHFNVIAPFAMGNRGSAYCDLDNDYFKRHFMKYDPLAVFRKECKDANLQLHPLVAVLPEGVETLNGILTDHPEWAMRSGDGKKQGWLDPAVPEVRAYRVKDFSFLARKYQLDGLCLDYCRLASGPSDAGADIYQKMTGKDPRTFKRGSAEYIEWYKWQSAQLDKLVAMIHDALHKINPDIIISAYVQGHKFSEGNQWEDLHQNFPAWLKSGDLDWALPTAYIYDMLRFKSWSKRQIDISHKANPNAPCLPTIGVITSHGTLNSSAELIEQVRILRELDAEGASFFRWEKLEQWIGPLKKEAYQKAVKTP